MWDVLQCLVMQCTPGLRSRINTQIYSFRHGTNQLLPKKKKGNNIDYQWIVSLIYSEKSVKHFLVTASKKNANFLFLYFLYHSFFFFFKEVVHDSFICKSLPVNMFKNASILSHMRLFQLIIVGMNRNVITKLITWRQRHYIPNWLSWGKSKSSLKI